LRIKISAAAQISNALALTPGAFLTILNEAKQAKNEKRKRTFKKYHCRKKTQCMARDHYKNSGRPTLKCFIRSFTKL
jgi:hypothetical protein